MQVVFPRRRASLSLRASYRLNTVKCKSVIICALSGGCQIFSVREATKPYGAVGWTPRENDYYSELPTALVATLPRCYAKVRRTGYIKSMREKCDVENIGCFFSCLNDKCRTDTLVSSYWNF
jgi:hypothetical protein